MLTLSILFLNKKDDCFFGKWQAGKEYCNGSVVIYNKTLYILVIDDAPDDCVPVDEIKTDGDLASVRTVAPPPSDEEPTGNCICSTTPPDQDNRWCPMELNVEDNDWEVIIEDRDDEGIMCAKVFGKIGMGTCEPCARLDITITEEVTDPDSGEPVDIIKEQYFFSPDGESVPTFTISKNEPQCVPDSGLFVKNFLNDQRSGWLTAAPNGYVFRELNTDNFPEYPEGTFLNKTEVLPEHQRTMLLIGHDVENQDKPAVGIGIENDADLKATLVVNCEGKAELLFQPSKKENAEIIMIDDLSGAFLSSGVKDEFAVFTSNRGYCFNVASDSATDYQNDAATGAGDPVLALTVEGNVGICTKDPQAKLEIYDEEVGLFCFSLEQSLLYPTLGIINHMPNHTPNKNFLSMGPINDYAVFITDAEEGFVFKNGKDCDAYNYGKDLTDGTDLVTIDPDGKVGICIRPEHYQLDVNGQIRSYETYQYDLDEEKTEYCEELEGVLDDLCLLKTVRYKWNEGVVKCDDGEEKIGLDGDNVDNFFPQLVRHHEDGSRDISYTNLVAVLVQGIKELKARVEALEGPGS